MTPSTQCIRFDEWIYGILPFSEIKIYICICIALFLSILRIGLRAVNSALSNKTLSGIVSSNTEGLLWNLNICENALFDAQRIPNVHTFFSPPAFFAYSLQHSTL